MHIVLLGKRKCCKYLSPSSTVTYLQFTILNIPTHTFSTLTFSSSQQALILENPNLKSATIPLAASLEQHLGDGSSSENHDSDAAGEKLTLPS